MQNLLNLDEKSAKTYLESKKINIGQLSKVNRQQDLGERVTSVAFLLGKKGWHNFSQRELALACFADDWIEPRKYAHVKATGHAVKRKYKQKAIRKSKETGLRILPIQILRDETGNYFGNLYDVKSLDGGIDASETDFRESRKILYPSIILKDPDAAYFLGICFGAGQMVRDVNNSGYAVKFTIQGDKHDHQLYEKAVEPLSKRFFSDDLELDFRVKRTLDELRDYDIPRVYFNSKAITTYFQNYLQFPVGEKYGLIIPEVITRASDIIKQNFLKGLIATMGHIKTNNTNKSKRLCIMDKAEKFLFSINAFFACTLNMYGTISYIPTTQQLNFTNADTQKLKRMGLITNPHHLSKLL